MIYERMKSIRKNHSKTQSQIAKVLNISRSTYAGWENNIDKIPLLKLNQFCNYFDISLDYVCCISDDINKKVQKKEINQELLGERLKEIRKKNNDTQKAVASIIKVDQSNYSKYELGKILIHTYPLIEFAKKYNVSIDWLSGKN